jgi:hypothetical protein
MNIGLGLYEELLQILFRSQIDLRKEKYRIIKPIPIETNAYPT